MAKRTIEGSSRCSASESTVWSVWTSPTEWPGGVIETAEIDGDFVVGARITLKTKGGPKSKSTITSIDAPRMWVGVSKLPGLTVTSEHSTAPAGSGTVVAERVTLSGPLAGVAARIIGARLAASFTEITGQIARVAEARESSQTST